MPKVILRSDLQGLGMRGDIVEVADGHFRNYLQPRGLAMVATDGAIAQAQKMRRARDQRDRKAREESQTIASTLVPKVIPVVMKAGPEGKLYGSVTAADVAEAVEAETGIQIDRKHITVESVKALGQHVVTASLHTDVSFPITIDVVAGS